MGVIYSNIRLANPYFPEQEEITVDALVDTGATHLCIPEHIALQLKLTTLKEREVVTADGAHKLVKYAGHWSTTGPIDRANWSNHAERVSAFAWPCQSMFIARLTVA